MHRSDLAVRQLKGSAIVILCRACTIRHTARVQRRGTAPDGPPEGDTPFSPSLLQCAAAHRSAVRVHAVDVVRDSLDVACAVCRTTHGFRLVECVTRSASSSA